MALFRFQARIVSRGKDQNAVNKAAYNARARLRDEVVYDAHRRLREDLYRDARARRHDEALCEHGQLYNYVRRGGVVFSVILAPDNAPDWATDREKLWNKVEEAEIRKESQLARELILALPHELTDEQRKDLLTGFLAEQMKRGGAFHGMVADASIHEPGRKGDIPNYHAHILLTMRSIGPAGFGPKVREWNGLNVLTNARRAWEKIQNSFLQRYAPGTSVSRLSLKDQNITTRLPKRRKPIKDFTLDRARSKPAAEAFKEQAKKLTGLRPSRGVPKNIVAQAAYNARTRLRDAAGGHVFDYSRRGELGFSGIFAPANAPQWAKDREQLWNRAAKARKLVLDLPAGLNAQQREWMVKDFFREQVVRASPNGAFYGIVADVSIPAPDKDGNYHAQILLPALSMGPEGFNQKAGEWNEAEILRKGQEAWEKLKSRQLQRFQNNPAPVPPGNQSPPYPPRPVSLKPRKGRGPKPEQ